jgi:hypothetical protein
MNKKPIIAAAISFALGACGVADHFQAQSRMEKSKDQYTKCVAANLNDPGQCDPLKAIYERDKAEYEKT